MKKLRRQRVMQKPVNLLAIACIGARAEFISLRSIDGFYLSRFRMRIFCEN